MNYGFLLGGKDINLAKEEVLSFLGSKKKILDGKLLLVELPKEVSAKNILELKNRLAFTHAIYRVLFIVPKKNILREMQQYDWQKIYRENFCVRRTKLSDNVTTKLTEKMLAAYIWHAVKNPKVDLEKPVTQINVFIGKNKCYCCLLLGDVHDMYEARKAHNRPFHHPSSLDPQLAKALINLSGAKKSDIIVDPFCGSGGFLIEAGLMGMQTIGYDLDEKMLAGCKKNLRGYGIKKSVLYHANALRMKSAEFVVTDLPYGFNSTLKIETKHTAPSRISLKSPNRQKNTEILSGFYTQFLNHLRNVLIKRAVIIFPHFVDYRRLLTDSGFTILHEFSVYIHGSLTRKIVVVE